MNAIVLAVDAPATQGRQACRRVVTPEVGALLSDLLQRARGRLLARMHLATDRRGEVVQLFAHPRPLRSMFMP